MLINMAMTADGKIVTANRAISFFSSKRDQEHMQELRATADAVMSGATTVDQKDVYLDTGGAKYERLRLRRGLARHALRVVVSGSGNLSPRADIFKKRFAPIIILTSERASKSRLAALRKIADAVGVFGRGELDVTAALEWLREEWGVRRLLCEGGGEVNDALLRAGAADEWHVTVCPRLFGGREAPTIVGGKGFARLADAAQLALVSRRRVGDEMFLVYRADDSKAV
ncbi:MAG TPA: dihydrofolate reductase family protein [Verrucomicrobiae bacterium]|nr:dihydrofolate reductase family protein [Verrucomicrobiae bacterium]